MKKTLCLMLTAILVLLMLPAAVAEGEPIELTFFSLNGDLSSARGEAVMDVVEAKILEDTGINCNINIISSDSFDTSMIALKVAAGELDLISSNMPWTEWQTFIGKGMLIEMDDLLDQYGANIRTAIDSKLWDTYKVDGKTYVIPVQSPVPFYCGTWVRMDLLEKYGYDVPTTVGELIEALTTVCANEPDMIGMTAGHISWIYNSGPLQYHPVDAEGNYTSANADGTAMREYVRTTTGQIIWFDDEGLKQSLQRSADLYASGVLDPEIFTTTFDHADQLVAADRVVCVGNAYGFQRTADEKPEQKWVFLTNLVNDINGGATTWSYSYEVGMHIGIVATTKHAAEIVQIIDWICASQENYALATWGVQGTDWDYDEDGYIERFRDESGNYLYSGGLGGIISNIMSDWYGPLIEKYDGTEWNKIYMGPPETVTWSTDDSFVNYSYETDPTIITDFQTMADEAMVNIVTGAIPVEEGLAQLYEDINSIGWADWYAEKNEQYCAALGIGEEG